jgi:predicted transposase YbfD/YdcC
MHEHFASLPDPRVDRRKLHALMDIVTIAIVAVIGNADGWDDIEEFGLARHAWLATFLPLKNGIPSADTFRRVVEMIDPQQFQGWFMSWMSELATSLFGKLVSIDGKTARGSFAGERGPLHLVSAWVAENATVLGELAVEDKSNEIVAIPKLVELLDLRGATVTIDAMGCQRAIAEAIVGKGGDYVLALKENQPTLHEEVRTFFEHAQATGWRDTAHTTCETADKGHGRIEVRRVWASSEVSWLDPKKQWAGLRSIVMVERERATAEKSSTERAFYVSSHEADAARLSDAIRGHWGIENTLHWTLDMTFHEDRSRIRSKNGTQNFAALRKIALALLKREPSLSKYSVARRRKRAGYLTDYLLTVLRGANTAP